MADTKISALSAVTAPATTDVVPIVNSGTTKKVTIANLVANSSPATLIIGAGAAITSSGAGGALGSNAFSSTAFSSLPALTDNATNILSTEPIAIGFGATTPPSGPLLMASSTINTSPRGILSAQFSTDTAGARVGFQ